MKSVKILKKRKIQGVSDKTIVMWLCCIFNSGTNVKKNWVTLLPFFIIIISFSSIHFLHTTRQAKNSDINTFFTDFTLVSYSLLLLYVVFLKTTEYIISCKYTFLNSSIILSLILIILQMKPASALWRIFRKARGLLTLKAVFSINNKQTIQVIERL